MRCVVDQGNLRALGVEKDGTVLVSSSDKLAVRKGPEEACQGSRRGPPSQPEDPLPKSQRKIRCHVYSPAHNASRNFSTGRMVIPSTCLVRDSIDTLR